MQILEEGEGFKDHFEYSYDPPPASSFSRAKGHDPRTATFPDTGLEAKSVFTHAPLPSRDETNTLCGRSDLDPASQWKRVPSYGEPNASLDRGNPCYCENLEQLLHQQQQMIQDFNRKRSSQRRSRLSKDSRYQNLTLASLTEIHSITGILLARLRTASQETRRMRASASRICCCSVAVFR